MVDPVLSSLASKIAQLAAEKLWDWSRGTEARQLVDLLKKAHPAARHMLTQPDCLIELYAYAHTGEFNRDAMLGAVRQIESDPAAAAALTDAIRDTQWRTKKDEELVHFEALRLRFELRRDVREESRRLLERLTALEERVAPSYRPPTPRQVPAPPQAFTDRERELRAITDAIDQTAARASLTLVTGPPGVGKSALLRHAAREAGDDFPDGQLHAELVAADGTVIELPEIVAGFLRALGVPSDAIPARWDERAALLRSVLTGKRVLVVLDGTPEGTSLEGLVPAVPGSALLVGGQSTLAPPGHVVVDVIPLAPADAATLLARLTGKNDGDAAEEIVERCGRLPLALSAVAAWLRRPGATHAACLARLRGELPDPVRRSIRLAYEQLSQDAARLLRALGAVRGTVISPSLASALLGHDAEAQLDELVDARLVEVREEGIGLHAMIHRFADELLSGDERALVDRRLVEWSLREARERSRDLRGGGADG